MAVNSNGLNSEPCQGVLYIGLALQCDTSQFSHAEPPTCCKQNYLYTIVHILTPLSACFMIGGIARGKKCWRLNLLICCTAIRRHRLCFTYWWCYCVPVTHHIPYHIHSCRRRTHSTCSDRLLHVLLLGYPFDNTVHSPIALFGKRSFARYDRSALKNVDIYLNLLPPVYDSHRLCF